MKKLIICLIITTVALEVINAQFTKAGGGLAFSSGFKFHNTGEGSGRSGNYAAFVKGIYNISPELSISPSFTAFYPGINDDGNIRTVVSSMMFDINGHYIFRSAGAFSFYGLAGLDILLTSKKDEYEDSDTFKESDNALGLNAGAGISMNLSDRLDLFTEIKYVISKYDQLIINSGILFNITGLSGGGKSGN
ncbi:MAG TPA: outer membrane beta-barrel protein [Bacteroidales bacterium]|jgi:opacity protein-like surface antigen|nr:outer membrane beta-barrel protein [Bacteroidales bacterium]HOX74571.1 outer membrane beta-barrel protein [Bacteroidales bacterium]HQM67807.1 outer membrane beta-barrel protein [Bacteroidales bacterium]